ncbi:MAG: carboxypeptidase-like regulatory domain-containing protein [Prevotellaceae bacterium]|jgi:hypothetical protein|nr:carboxypeptidase-like regulatory domain-containing protein [Prevotellaceae bacterium]
MTLILNYGKLFARNDGLVQTIRGAVVDRSPGGLLPFITVALLSLLQMGATTDDNVKVVLQNVPVGQHDLF